MKHFLKQPTRQWIIAIQDIPPGTYTLFEIQTHGLTRFTPEFCLQHSPYTALKELARQGRVRMVGPNRQNASWEILPEPVAVQTVRTTEEVLEALESVLLTAQAQGKERE